MNLKNNSDKILAKKDLSNKINLNSSNGILQKKKRSIDTILDYIEKNAANQFERNHSQSGIGDVKGNTSSYSPAIKVSALADNFSKREEISTERHQDFQDRFNRTVNKPFLKNRYDFVNESNYDNLDAFDVIKSTNLFSASEAKAKETISFLPRVTKKNQANIYRLQAIEEYANKIHDADLARQASKSYGDLICENAFDRDYELPPKLDNFKFDGIIESIREIGQGVKNYINNRFFHNYLDENGNVVFFNLTHSTNVDISTGKIASVDALLGQIDLEIETGANEVCKGIGTKTRGLYNIDYGKTISSTGEVRYHISPTVADLGLELSMNAFPAVSGNIVSFDAMKKTPFFHDNSCLMIGATVGLTKTGVILGAEIGVEAADGTYQKYKINANAYYETVVALGIAYLTAGSSIALAPVIEKLVTSGAIIPA